LLIENFFIDGVQTFALILCIRLRYWKESGIPRDEAGRRLRMAGSAAADEFRSSEVHCEAA
jgi:hypothetical protein